MKYGDPPFDLGPIDITPTEMMFWMYLPISEPGNILALVPPNLRQFDPILNAVRRDNEERWFESYVYLTVKTLWVTEEYIGNRPGWHSDGFGTDDLNYIWSDRAPTDFLIIPGGITLSKDCDESMRQMRVYGLRPEMYGGGIQTYPDKHLLRLDETVVHRSPTMFEPGMRTFVKVSVSKDRYDLLGNSINHDLPSTRWPLVDRKLERNHPQSRFS